jgi:hypothetical protein
VGILRLSIGLFVCFVFFKVLVLLLVIRLEIGDNG